MNRLFKTLLVAAAGIVLLVVLSAAALMMFFDPNDFRERIAAEVEAATGRELVIEGDLSVSLFPWLAVEVGRTELGNAEGFDKVPFASFESARLSVRLLPLLLKREIMVGTAELDALRLELMVNNRGVSNWDDLVARDSAEADTTATADSGPRGLDISSVAVNDAYIHYSDAQAGSAYTLERLSLVTGRIASGEAVSFTGGFDFKLRPDDIEGQVKTAGSINIADDVSSVTIGDFAIDGQANGLAAEPTEFRFSADDLVVNLDDSSLAPTELRLSVLGIDARAGVRSLSWGEGLAAEASVRTTEFSPRDAAARLDIELPPTADPAVLGRAALKADIALKNQSLGMKNLDLRVDDTAFSGEVVAPIGGTAPIRFELQGDRLHLDRYMAPPVQAGPGGGAGSADDFEIPVDMIRRVNVRGNLRLAEAQFSGIQFTAIQLALNAANGKLRLNPVAAKVFDGTYTGDVQVDAAGGVPTLSLNERIADVNLSPLGRAMFEHDELSGSINGNFVLKASGRTLNSMRRNLNGNMAFELADGAWEGVDLWHQLRVARALYRREPPPTARAPARTEFSSVVASGPVVDGVFVNDKLAAAMPHLQLTGTGKVDLVSGEIDYALRARVLERPELLKGVTEAELAEFTEALIPVRVRGTLAEPSIRPDIEAMFREQVDGALKKKTDELKKRLLDRLAPTAPADQAPAGEEPVEGEEQEAAKEQDIEGQLKDRLKKLFD